MLAPHTLIQRKKKIQPEKNSQSISKKLLWRSHIQVCLLFKKFIFQADREKAKIERELPSVGLFTKSPHTARIGTDWSQELSTGNLIWDFHIEPSAGSWTQEGNLTKKLQHWFGTQVFSTSESLLRTRSWCLRKRHLIETFPAKTKPLYAALPIISRLDEKP